jgi:hypothetical protein
VSVSSGREEGAVHWKFVISAIVMFVMSLGLGMLIHGVLLHDDYARYPNLMRPLSEVQAKLPVSALAHGCIALAFSWIYLKGREEKAGPPKAGAMPSRLRCFRRSRPISSTVRWCRSRSP